VSDTETEKTRQSSKRNITDSKNFHND